MKKINIVIPLAGTNQFFDKSKYPYPVPLIEIKNKMIIERVVNNFNSIKRDKQFIFILKSEDCKKYHLDKVLNLIMNDTYKVIKLENKTKGALCSVMMAIEHINNDTSLIVANSDQLFDDNLDEVISGFDDVDGGVITFESIHPRWSYAITDESGYIVETAEKSPLSKNAIAGFFYFNHGRDFIDSAMSTIKKDANLDGSYYISSTFNEMVLQNKRLVIHKIDNNKYHTFYSPKKIQEYESGGN